MVPDSESPVVQSVYKFIGTPSDPETSFDEGWIVKLEVPANSKKIKCSSASSTTSSVISSMSFGSDAS